MFVLSTEKQTAQWDGVSRVMSLEILESPRSSEISLIVKDHGDSLSNQVSVKIKSHTGDILDPRMAQECHSCVQGRIDGLNAVPCSLGEVTS